MGKGSGTFSKREKEKQRLQNRQEKERKKEERKANGGGTSFEDMLAYVDENGNLTSTPPDQTKKRVIKESDIDLTSRNKGGSVASFVRTGFIKFFNEEKGFGFIKDSASGEEFFFHFQSANYEVKQSDRVTFDTGHGPKGMVALKISKA